MARTIDDFTTGEDEFDIPDKNESLREGQMAGGKRHVVFSGFTANRNQRAHFQIHRENRLNLTVPTGADIQMNIIYGTQGAKLQEDWSKSKAFQIDIGSYDSAGGATFTIVAFTDSGRLSVNGKFPAKPTDQPILLSRKFSEWVEVDNPNLARINAINIVMVLQGGIFIKEISVI